MQVVARPHLFSTRDRTVVEDIDYGMTIDEVVNRLGMFDKRVREYNLAVIIDGEMLPREQWKTRALRPADQRVEFAVVPQGGGRSKQILGLVAILALSFFVGPASTFLTSGEGALLAGYDAMLVKAGLMMVGTLAIHAIFAPPKLDPAHGGDESPTYSFSGQSNQPRRFARLPRIYGRHRYVADLAALPYTVNKGSDSYLYGLYSFGYGPLKLEDFRIGQNPLTNYKDYDIRVHENFTNASQLQLFKNDVWQDSFSFELKQGTPVVVATQANTEIAIVDITFPQGLLSLDDEGDWDFLTSDIAFLYRPTGGTGWSPIAISEISRGAADVQEGNFVVGGQPLPGFYPPGEIRRDANNVPIVIPGWPAGTNRMNGWMPAGFRSGNTATIIPGTVMNVGPYVMTVDYVQGWSGPDETGFPRNVGGQDVYPTTVVFTSSLPGNLQIAPDDPTVSFRYVRPEFVNNSVGTNVLHISEKTRLGFSISASFRFPVPGQYEIQVTKIEPDFGEDDTKHLWQRFVSAVRSVKTQPPVSPEVPMTVVELVIKATGQLNGTIDQFSAIATSVLRYWTGSAWTTGPTQNPAWVYLDILQGSANNRPIPDHRIDLTALREWAVYCDQIVDPFVGPTGTCDAVVDRQFTLWELLQNVAATGRAAPTMRDNKYSILIDTADREPVQMFTPRNSSNLRSSRTYIDEPHALRVKWIDPLKNYEAAEILVYNTGRNDINSTVFEDLQSFGMTRAEQVLRWGRYMLAQGKLRQERFTIDVDIEHIVCMRGDLVLVAHDVIEVGGDPSRIVEIDGNRLFVDAPPSMDVISDPSAYGVRIRKSSGYVTAVLDVLEVGFDGEFDYIDVSGDLSEIIADNLLVLGPKSQVVGEYVVDTIRPGNDMSATIGLEEYAPAVYTAEFNGLENLTYTPQGMGMGAPAVRDLKVEATVTYVDGKPMATVRASWRPAEGFTYQPDDYRVWILTPTGNEEYLGVTNNFYWDAGPYDLTTLNGYEFIFRVRPFYGARGLGPVAEANVIVVYEPRQPPRLMDFFDVINLPAGARRYVWSYTDNVIPTNVVGIRVRYILGNITAPAWVNGVDVVNEGAYSLQNGAELHSPPGAGTYTFMARTVDEKGQMSTASYVLVKELTVDFSQDLTPPPTPTGFLAVGGMGVVFFNVDNPIYTMGGGHDYTQVYYSTIDEEFDLATTKPFVGFNGTNTSAGAEPATNYKFWATWVSRAGVQSLVPAGPIYALTSINVQGTLDALTGQITADQLHDSLGTRIDLIDGSSALPGSVNERLAAEAAARAAADTNEADARAAAVLAEQTARISSVDNEAITRANADAAEATARASAITTAISTEVADRNAAIAVETENRTDAIAAEAAARGTAITNEATIRQSGDDALSQQISLVTAGVAGGFDYGRIWYYDANDEGWTTTGAVQTWNAGWLDIDSSGTVQQTLSPAGLAVAGATYPIVKARIRRLAGSGWLGRVHYTTTAGPAPHGMSMSYYKTADSAVSPAAVGDVAVIEWDMSALTAGGTDWINSTIGQIRLDLAASAADTFSVDWIAIGRNAPGASTAGLVSEQTARISGDTALASDITALTARVGTTEANILTEQTARASGDTANANSITALTTTVNSNTSAITTEQTARANADTALSTSIATLAAKTEGSFDPSVTWNFDSTVEGWSATNATVTWMTGGVMRGAPTVAGISYRSSLSSPLAVNGSLYNIVRARITRVSGSGWGTGNCFYRTAVPSNVIHGESGGMYKSAPNPNLAIGQSAVVEWDMANLTAGGTDWLTSTISAIRLDIGAGVDDVFDFDWIVIGRKAPGASSAALITEQAARAAGDTANASNITLLSASVARTRSTSMVETWSAVNALDSWDMTVGAGEAVLTTDAEVQGGVLQIGDNGGTSDQLWPIWKENIPFDPDKLYKMTVRIKRTAGNGVVYAGVGGIAADGVSWVAYNGNTTKPGQHYLVAAGVNPGLNVWVTYTGYIKGWAAAGVSGGVAPSTDPKNPRQVHANVRYLRPQVMVNYSLVSGITLIGKVDFTEVPADVVAADLLVEQTTRATADTAMSNQLTALTAKVEGGNFDSFSTFNFDTTVEGFTPLATNTLTWMAGGYMRLTSGGTTPTFNSPTGLGINGSLYPIVRARVTRVAGAGWGLGRVTYATVAPSQLVHGISTSYAKNLPDPGLAIGQSTVLEWDMANLTAGGNDWINGTIGQLQFLLGNTAADVFDIDWITVGRKAPGASISALTAEQTARATGDTAITTNLNALSASVTRTRDGVLEEWIASTAQVDNWTVGAGTGELSIVTDPGYVGNVLQAGNNLGNDSVMLLHKDLIPFDPTKQYRLSADFMRTVGTGQAYLGFVGVAADGVTFVNVNGANNVSSAQHYHGAFAVQPVAWTNYLGYTKGFAATTGDTTSFASPLNPGKVHPLVRYLRLGLWMNYPTATGTTLVGRVSVTSGEPDVVAANLVTEQSTRATADTANATSITNLTARVTTNEGNISTNASGLVTEQTTRANADSALSTNITNLTASVTAADTRLRTGFVENWATTAKISDWDRAIGFGGAGELTITTDASFTGSVLQVGNNAGDDFVWMVHKDLIPFDPNKLYRMSVSVKKTAAAASGQFFAGYQGIAADGVTLVNNAGAASPTPSHYHVANSLVLPVGTLTNLVGYTKGHAAIGANGDITPSTDPLVPRKMHSSVRYLRALIGANYLGTSTTIVGRVEVTSGEPDVVAANLLTEQTTRASADTANATNITALTARVGTAEGAIVTEQSARATGDTVLTSSVNLLKAAAQPTGNLIENSEFVDGLRGWVIPADQPNVGVDYSYAGYTVGDGTAYIYEGPNVPPKKPYSPAPSPTFAPVPAPSPSPTPSPSPAPTPAPSPTPAPPPSGTQADTVEPLISHPVDWLMTGNTGKQYAINDGRWGWASRNPAVDPDLTEGPASWQFRQFIERSRTPNVEDGSIAAGFHWYWPQYNQAGHSTDPSVNPNYNEVKAYPSMVHGWKPGFYGSSMWNAYSVVRRAPDGVVEPVPNPSYTPTNIKDFWVPEGGSVMQDYPAGGTGNLIKLPIQLPLTNKTLRMRGKYLFRSPPTGKGHLAFDMFLCANNTQVQGFAQSPITHEIMIPLINWGGYGAFGERNPGWYDHDTTIDGVEYAVYVLKDDPHNDATGQVDGAGPGPGGYYPGVRYNFGGLDPINNYINEETGVARRGWKFIVFQHKNPTDHHPLDADGYFVIDYKKFLAHAALCVDSRNIPWIQNTEWVPAIELGSEMIYGDADYVFYNYLVQAEDTIVAPPPRPASGGSPAPSPTPAPGPGSASGTTMSRNASIIVGTASGGGGSQTADQILQARFDAGNTGWWGKQGLNEFWLSNTDHTHPAGSSVIGVWINHGNPTNGRDFVEANNANRPNMTVGTPSYVNGYVGAPMVNVGGSTGDFYSCFKAEVTSYYGTLFSDGQLRVRFSGDYNKIYFSAYGVTELEIPYTGGGPYTAAGLVLIEAWIRGTTWGLRLNRGTPVTATLPGVTRTPGNANMLLFGHTGGADNIVANVRRGVVLVNYCPSQADQDIIAADFDAAN